MSPAAIRFVELAQRRLAGLQPDVASALLRSLQIIRDSLSDAELARLITDGSIERLLAKVFSDQSLDRALLPFRAKLRTTVERSFKYATPSLPGAGKIDGVVSVAFDHLSPKVIDAVRTLETRVLSSLKDDVREVVRTAVRLGLESQRAPAAVARDIRGVIGLGASQLEQVENYRAALVAGRSASNYTLRNKTIDRLLAKGPLTADQVARYTEQYRKARIASNANTVAHTATRDSYKLGQKLAWQDAIDSGVVPDDFQVMRTWLHFDPQPNPRPEHIAMNGETVPIDQAYSNGDTFAGESDSWNCKCIDRYSVARVA